MRVCVCVNVALVKRNMRGVMRLHMSQGVFLDPTPLLQAERIKLYSNWEMFDTLLQYLTRKDSKTELCAKVWKNIRYN